MVGCGSVNKRSDGSFTFSCGNILLCKYRARSLLEESQAKWKNLNLANYSYSQISWHPDEPPPCDDEVTVSVKNSVVQSAELISCESKQKKTVSQTDLKNLNTIEENYSYCRDKVLKEAPIFSNVFFEYDGKGVLMHCHFYEKYWGYSAGGKVIYKD